MNEIILIGGGGHCKSVLQGMKYAHLPIHGIIDREEKLGQSILGIPIIATDADLATLVQKGFRAIVTVGSIKNNDIRRNLYNHVVEIGFKMATFVSDKAIIAEGASIGAGSVVLDAAVINADSKIGENCVVNTGAIIEHDCTLGHHIHVAPGAVVGGGVSISDLAFIGSGAVIKQGVKIGRSATIGAGAVVLKDVADGEVCINKWLK